MIKSNILTLIGVTFFALDGLSLEQIRVLPDWIAIDSLSQVAVFTTANLSDSKSIGKAAPCTAANGWPGTFVITDLNSAASKRMLSILLESRLTKTPIDILGTGTCPKNEAGKLLENGRDKFMKESYEAYASGDQSSGYGREGVATIGYSP